MSEWADFCEDVGIDPNDPDQFDTWLSRQSAHDKRRGVGLVSDARDRGRQPAAPQCPRGGGPGYIGRYRWNRGGRCFRCVSDDMCRQARRE